MGREQHDHTEFVSLCDFLKCPQVELLVDWKLQVEEVVLRRMTPPNAGWIKNPISFVDRF